jgi:hypothetical protein
MVEFFGLKINDSREISARVTIKNFGSTPAYNVRHWACVSVSAFLDQDIDFPTAAEIINSYPDAPGSLIPPAGRLDKVIDHVVRKCKGDTVSAEDLSAIREGHKTVFAVGIIRYRDAFHREWITHYRRGWDPVHNGVDGYKGNCADEDCRD